MNINITLFAQMLNFFIAYTIIVRLFLKPVYEYIQADEHEQKKLLDAVSHESKKVAAQHILKQEKWLDCQRSFQENKPDLDMVKSRIKKEAHSLEALPALESKQIKELADNISSALKAKVSL
jgi:septal ring factor EnvC (AmiA/AmiB activator)